MKKPKPRTTGILALIATFLVVGGVVFVAVLATPKINPDAQIPELPQPVTASPAASSTRVLVVDQNGARIVQGGESMLLTWPDDAKLLGRPASQLEGVDALTGERVYLGNGFERAESPGLRSPDGRRSLHPAPPKADGTGSVEVRLGTDRQVIVLRFANGKGLKEGTPVGWWDAETIAVIGRATSTRMVYAASLTGVLTPVAILPETANRIATYSGAVWYITAEPGEGLESPFIPPSSLHRVTRAGKDELLVDSDDQVIMTYVPSGDEVAYETQDEALFLLSNRVMRDVPLGSGTPLAFRDAAHLLLRRGDSIVSKDVVTGLEEVFMKLPKSGAALFPLPASSTTAE